MSKFTALLVEKDDKGEFTRNLVERDTSALPEGDVLIDVKFSSLNFKDALSATGNPGVSRNFPHTPGIDAAGTVLESSDSRVQPGTEVLVTGYDLGMNTSGGFGQRIRVPGSWVVCLDALSMRDSMIIGTAGLTAALCIEKLLHMGLEQNSGKVLVTGASGGVGSFAVALLSQLGFEVSAVSGKPEQTSFLEKLGASEVISRKQFMEGAGRPMLKEQWAGVVDSVGGEMLFAAIKSLRYGGSAAACGLVASMDIPATVLPFILRSVNLLGIDSVELPLDKKQAVWKKLGNEWRLKCLEDLVKEIRLSEVSSAIDTILAGKMVGRGLVIL